MLHSFCGISRVFPFIWTPAITMINCKIWQPAYRYFNLVKYHVKIFHFEKTINWSFVFCNYITFHLVVERKYFSMKIWSNKKLYFHTLYFAAVILAGLSIREYTGLCNQRNFLRRENRAFSRSCELSVPFENFGHCLPNWETLVHEQPRSADRIFCFRRPRRIK